MVMMQNMNAQSLELPDEPTNFLLMRIAALIAKLFVFFATEDFINPSGNSICNGDFCLVCRT